MTGTAQAIDQKQTNQLSPSLGGEHNATQAPSNKKKNFKAHEREKP